MSRIIKFRAWDYKISRFHYFDCDQTFRAAGWWEMVIKENMPISQFTGLLDKNKKEIYEGDICRGPNGKHWEIEWIGHSWSMTNKIIPNGPMKFGGEETYSIDKWLTLPPRKQELEIIGNIFENPDPLK